MKIKTSLIILVAIGIFLNINNVYLAQGNRLDLAVRYLKLGNTYREAAQFEKAVKFFNKGKKITESNKSWQGRYWNATAYEYYGYLFRDIGMPDEAKENLKIAIKKFQALIEMKDGSQVAVKSAMESINAIAGQIKKLSMTSVGEQLDILNFDKQKAKKLPDGIPDDVENLSLAENRFTSLPSGVTRFSKLRYLNLADNRIKEIPESISELTNLHWLDLSGNRLKTLPVRIAELQNLKELDLSGNRLKNIPASICNMKGLQILNLKRNKIPFEKITNIIKCLPNTNVLFDEYILKTEAEEGL